MVSANGGKSIYMPMAHCSRRLVGVGCFGCLWRLPLEDFQCRAMLQVRCCGGGGRGGVGVGIYRTQGTGALPFTVSRGKIRTRPSASWSGGDDHNSESCMQAAITSWGRSHNFGFSLESPIKVIEHLLEASRTTFCHLIVLYICMMNPRVCDSSV
jgi:hypothetical protein